MATGVGRLLPLMRRRRGRGVGPVDGPVAGSVSGASKVDYAAVFAAILSPCLLLGPDLTIVEANAACVAATGRPRDELVGPAAVRGVPGQCAGSRGRRRVRNLRAYLVRVRRLGVGGHHGGAALRRPGPGRRLRRALLDPGERPRHRHHRTGRQSDGSTRPNRTCSLGPRSCTTATGNCGSRATSSRCARCTTPDRATGTSGAARPPHPRAGPAAATRRLRGGVLH